MNKLQVELIALGNTKEEIGKRLILLGIKGHRNSSCGCPGCPLVNYLLSKGFSNVTVAVESGISADFGEDSYNTKHTDASLRFLHAFDEGDIDFRELNYRT